jgi:O-antigen/teichoic acid export membrane protein
VAVNTAAQAAGKAAVLLIGVASVAVVTRYLGAADYGKLALALAFVQMLGVLADVGLLTIVVREISREPARSEELVGNAIVLRLVLSLGVVALSALAALALDYPADVRTAILIAGAPLTLGMVNTAIVAIFQARLLMGRSAIADVAGRALAFAAVVVVVALDLGFYAVVATTGLGAAVTLAVSWALGRRLVPLHPRADRRVWRSLLAASVPVGVTLAVNEVYFRADTFILSLFRDYDEVGSYALAYRIVELLAIFPAIVMTSVFPLLARYVEQEPALVRRTVDTAAGLFLALALPLAVGGLFAAPGLVEALGGDGFDAAVTPLRILLFAGGLAALSGLLGYTLIAAGRQRSALWLSLVALALNLALNFALVPSLGADAAAVVALGCELVILAGGIVLVRRHLHLVPRLATLWPSLLAAAAMAAALWAVSSESLALLLPVGIVVYAVVLYLTGGVDRRALAALRS